MNNKFIRKIISILGFSTVATSCELIEEIGGGGMVNMYGTPSADYVFNAEVKDKDNDQPIEGIRVSAIVEHQYWDSSATAEQIITDTLAKGFTDSDGRVVLNINDFPKSKHTLAFDDVDGTENGGDYASVEIDVTTDSKDYKNPGENGWYSGTATHDVSVKLSKKSE